MGKDVVLHLSADDLMLLLMAVNDSMETLEDRYSRSDYFFHAYKIEKQRQLSEDNRTMFMARMYQLDRVKSYLMSCVPMNL